MISEIIEKWIKGILIDGITGNLSGLFDNVNAKVGEIASDVGSTPQAWNSGIFNMLRSLSETVVLPIAAAILALVMCHELIQMITEKNNMHDFDTSICAIFSRKTYMGAMHQNKFGCTTIFQRPLSYRNPLHLNLYQHLSSVGNHSIDTRPLCIGH